MTVKYTDYICLKTGRYQSVGKFGDNIYAYEVLTGVTDSRSTIKFLRRNSILLKLGAKSTFRILKKYEIINRPVICSGYLGRAELNLSLLRNI